MPIIHWIDGFKGGIPAPGRERGAVVEEIVSHHGNVTSELHSKANQIARKASALLAVAQARHPGVSTAITTSRGVLDYHVHLVSNRGGTAARAIEYGHTGTGRFPRDHPLYRFQKPGKRYPGQFILHRASGLRYTPG